MPSETEADQRSQDRLSDHASQSRKYQHLSLNLVLPDSALKNGRISGIVLQTTSFMQSIQQLANASAIISLPAGMR